MKCLRETGALLLLGTLCSASLADSITGSSSGSEDVDYGGESSEVGLLVTSTSHGWQTLDNRTDAGFNQTWASEDKPTTGNRLERWSTFCADGMVMVIFS